MPTDFPSFQLPESHSVGIQCFGCKTAEWKCRNAVSCALGAFLKAAPGGLQHIQRQKAGLTLIAQCCLFLLNKFLPFTNVSLSALPHTLGSWDKSQGRPDLAPGSWLLDPGSTLVWSFCTPLPTLQVLPCLLSGRWPLLCGKDIPTQAPQEAHRGWWAWSGGGSPRSPGLSLRLSSQPVPLRFLSKPPSPGGMVVSYLCHRTGKPWPCRRGTSRLHSGLC